MIGWLVPRPPQSANDSRGVYVMSQSANEDMIVLKNLTKSYTQGITAIQDISLTIKKGEFIVLFGPSGVGKSTLLRCINYLVKPTSGEVIVDGQNLGRLARSGLLRIRQGVGMIFQEFNLVNRMSVLTNVLSGGLGKTGFLRALTYSFSHREYEMAIKALRRAGLEDETLYLRRPDTLSGGQRQRVGIARMLVQEPKVILADEPIASLDLKMQHTIMELIADIATKDGITVVMSLHNIEIAKQYVSRIVGLCRGQITFDGPPKSLTTDVINKIFNLGAKLTDDRAAAKSG